MQAEKKLTITRQEAKILGEFYDSVTTVETIVADIDWGDLLRTIFMMNAETDENGWNIVYKD